MDNYITLKLTDHELQQLFLFLVAPKVSVGENTLELVDIISLLLKAVGR